MKPIKNEKTVISLLILMTTIGCSSRDQRLTRMAAQQAQLNAEMAKLNRDVVQGLARITQENAEFRREALLMQKQLHEQRAELIRKQETLDEERRRYAQRDPLIAKAVCHVGLVLGCLLPLGLCWYLLRQPVEQQIDPDVSELLLRDVTSESPVLLPPGASSGPPRLRHREESEPDDCSFL